MAIAEADPAPDAGGLYCYVVTPYDAGGNVDLGILAEYVTEIVRMRVTGVTCIASTCEGPYLTEAERAAVVDTVGKVAGGRCKVNVGVGALSTRQVIENALRAKDAGATSLMLEMQQYFPVGFDEAYRHYADVAAAVELPIRLYNLTVPTHFDFTPERIALMSGIARISSVKEASHEVNRIREIRSLCGKRFTVYCGFHYQALEGFRLGAAGWEVMMHPSIAPDCVNLYNLLRADPWCSDGEALFRRLEPLFVFFKHYGVPQSIKALSNWTRLPLGRPRAPLRELPANAASRLRELIAELSKS
jgi:dihydrodipicolinate synthase/N-acetylneuraminate lyase